MSDKSSVYGYYGRISDESLYVPPATIPFVPYPSAVLLVMEEEVGFIRTEDGEMIDTQE